MILAQISVASLINATILFFGTTILLYDLGSSRQKIHLSGARCAHFDGFLHDDPPGKNYH